MFWKRTLATAVDLPLIKPTSTRMSNPIAPRINVLGQPLQIAPVGQGPATGFFRNSYCDASSLDRASHTIAAVITPQFLSFSASRGNDLSSLFPTSGPLAPNSGKCVWCLCASRWKEALLASKTHEGGEGIVPKVWIESCHKEGLERGGISLDELKRFRVGGGGTEGESCENKEGGEGMNGGDRVAR